MELINQQLTANDVLVQTHLMTFISEVGDKDFTPIPCGSVFVVYDKGQRIFVTGDYTLYLDDYNSAQENVNDLLIITFGREAFSDPEDGKSAFHFSCKILSF